MSKASSHQREGHRKRLREKFLSSGLAGFHDYEVIELLLTLGTPRKDCKPAAKAALTRFKSLQGVFEASKEELCRVEGIGPQNVFGIKLIKAVAQRYLEKKLLGKETIHNSRDLINYLNSYIRDRNRESFVMILLDAKNRVLATQTLSEGTLTASSVYPREVVRTALEHHAASVIFAHNHPSGDTKPSHEDISITRQLVFACKVMGIQVHEHLIIGGDGYFSFADEGRLSHMKMELEKYTSSNHPLTQ
ncbi:MAG TPA: DNA repair protein RadC [Deltaproteobacteria bacterium]|nr:DNA repair protein RadC [Deltaproteobacteria bacterium]